MLFVRHPDTYKAERAYILDVVLGDFLGLEWEGQLLNGNERFVELTVSDGEDRRLLIADGLFAVPRSEWLSARSLPARPLATWTVDRHQVPAKLVDSSLPVLFGARTEQGAFVQQRSSTVTLRVDMFGAIFFQLTRYEELAHPVRDEHGRFPESASLAYQEGFLGRPLVNEYVELLKVLLKRIWPGLATRRRTFQQRLTHDVDYLVHPPTSRVRLTKAIGGDLIRRRDPGRATSRVKALAARRAKNLTQDPYNAFDFIMDVSEAQGLRSAFYFKAGATHPDLDTPYSLNDPWVSSLLTRIHERGHEIGLHPSYETFCSADLLRAERDALLSACQRCGISQDAWGGRQHFLRWRNPDTWRGFAEAGLSYDSSLGYPHRAGFRCGSCFEYQVFDLLEHRPLGLRERPLTVMEMSVFTESTPAASALEEVRILRERCRMFEGDFTLLWHNSQLASPRQRRMYRAAAELPF